MWYRVIRFFKEILLIQKGVGSRFMLKYLWCCIKHSTEIVRTKSLYPADKEIIRPIRVHRDGYNLIFTPDAIALVRELVLNNCYGFNMNKNYIDVIDLGANKGVFTILAGKVGKRVIAVESNHDEMPDLFSENMRLNEIKNTIFVNKFISNYTDANHLSMDDLMIEHEIDKIDFLKIDIEGDENFLFLYGDPVWLDRTREISMEVHPCFGVDVEGITKKLENWGFKVSLYDKELRPVRQIDSGSMGYVRAMK